jgi:membrane protease subunit (stomatin/prohibitin family)
MQRHSIGPRVIRKIGLAPVRGLRRGRLVRGLVIGSLGYMLGRQQAQFQQQQAAQTRSNAQSEQLAQLKQLGELRESGVLTEEEFQLQKRRILQTS